MANLESVKAVVNKALAFYDGMLRCPSLKNINAYPDKAIAEVNRRVEFYKGLLEQTLAASTTDGEYAEIAAAMATIGGVMKVSHEAIATYIGTTLKYAGICENIVAEITEPLTNHMRRFMKMEELYNQPRFWSTGAEDMNKTAEHTPFVEQTGTMPSSDAPATEEPNETAQ